MVFHALVGIFCWHARRASHSSDLEAVLHPLDLVPQQMPRIDNVLVVLQPIAIFDKADGIVARQAHAG